MPFLVKIEKTPRDILHEDQGAVYFDINFPSSYQSEENVSNKRSRYKWDTFLWPIYLEIRKSCCFQDEYKWAKRQWQR